MKKIKQSFFIIITILLTLGLSISLQSLLAAWTGPTTTPPGGNASGAINIGSSGQSKAGGLILNTGGSTNGLIVQFGKVGIGTTSPSGNLDVAGRMVSVNYTNANNRHMTFLGYGGSTWDLIGGHGGGGYFGITENNSASPFLSILGTSGNLGIGTNNPQQKLDVNGAIAVSGSTVIDAGRNWQGGTIGPSKGGTGLSSCGDGKVLKWASGAWTCGDETTGGTLLWSNHTQLNSTATEGNCSNPRFVSADLTTIIKNNCVISLTNTSRCHLAVNNYPIDTYGEKLSYEFIITYYPVGYNGNQKETLELYEYSGNRWYLLLNDGTSNGCDWRGYLWTVCERYGNSCGTWISDNSPDGKINFSVDRAAYGDRWHVDAKLLKQ